MRNPRLAAAVAVLALAFAVPASALAASAATVPHSRPELKFPFDHHTCFEGPFARDHTKPGGTCWAGGICLDPAQAHFLVGDSGVWCMGQRRKNQQHPAEGRVMSLRNEATKDHEYFIVDLIGYVRFDPGNPIPGHTHWPFKDPNLDHVFDGYPVVQLVFVPGGKVTHSIRIECVNDNSLSDNKPASFGRCGQEHQFALDTHDSFFVWPSPGHRIDGVHLTNTEHHGTKVYCLFADDPAAGPPPWFVRMSLPAGEIHITGVLQFWHERHIAHD